MTTLRLYDDLNILPLDCFIQCVCNNSLEVLIIEGKADEDTLIACWNKLYADYLDLLEDYESIYILQLRRNVLILTQRIIEIETSLYFLVNVYDERLVQIIKRNGVKVQLNPQDEDNYYQDIEKVKGRINNLKFQLELKEEEINVCDKANHQGVIDRKFFTTILLKLARMQGVAFIRPKDIMTLEYVLLLKEFISMNTKKEKYGEKRSDYNTV